MEETSKSWSSLWFFAAMLGLASQGPDARASEATEPRKAAYERFKEGEIAFEDGNFQRAAALFGEAHSLYPEPAYLFNRGLSFAKLGRHVAAEAVFQRFLEVFPGSPRKAEVEARIQEAIAAQGMAARVEVSSVPVGRWARIVDGGVPELEALGCLTPCMLRADPGAALVLVARDEPARAGRDLAARVTLEAGGREEVSLDLMGSAGPSKTATWVAWSVGGVSLVTGIVFGVLTADAYDEGMGLRDRGTVSGLSGDEERRLTDLQGRVRDYGTAADIGFAVAAAAAVVGAVALLSGGSGEEPAPGGVTWRF